MYQALHAVESLITLEGATAKAVHVGYLDQFLSRAQHTFFACRDVVLFILFKLKVLATLGQRIFLAGVAQRVSGVVRLVNVRILDLPRHGRSESSVLVLVVLSSKSFLALRLGQKLPTRLLAALGGYCRYDLISVTQKLDNEVEIIEPNEIGQLGLKLLVALTGSQYTHYLTLEDIFCQAAFSGDPGALGCKPSSAVRRLSVGGFCTV